jgi:surface protein
MFFGASSFDSDLSQWQTGKVTNMSMMFCDASSFNSDLSQWQSGNVTNMMGMFHMATSLQEIPSWYTRFIS